MSEQTEATYSNRELLLERDELLLKLAQARARNSDLQQHVNALEQAALVAAQVGNGHVKSEDGE